MDYWKKNKKQILPWVTNWKSPQNHIRYEKNVKKLEFTEWFFCHPTAYKLINYGSDVISALIFISLAVLCWFKGLTFLAFLSTAIVLFNIYTLKKKIVLRYENRHTTYYDLWMREY